MNRAREVRLSQQSRSRRRMSKTVLSIEDDDAVEMLLQVAFRGTARDFRLIRVPNGEEGLAFLRRTGAMPMRKDPDLVLLDINMPGISGPDTCRLNSYSPGVSTWSCERILSPQRRHTISAPAIVVSSPSCSRMYCGASCDIAIKPPHPTCLLISVTIRIVSILKFSLSFEP